MEESTSIALPDSGSVATAPALPPGDPGGGVATVPPSQPVEAPRETAVTSKHSQYFTSTPSQDSRELQPGEPERLNSDGKTSDAWMNWMIKNLPRAVEAGGDEAEPAPAQLAHFGLNLPQIESALDSLANMYEGIEGCGEALAQVYDADPVTYSNIVATITAADPTFVLGCLEQQGAIPSGLFDPAPPAALPHDLERWISDDLYETATALSPSLLYQWLAESHATLINNLRTQAELNDVIAVERERAKADWDDALDRALDKGERTMQEVSDYYLAQHEKQLNAWRPVGQNERGNNILRTAVFYGAWSDLLSNPQFHAIHKHMEFWLKYGPSYRVHGQHAEAERGEQRARQFAAQIHTRLGQLIRDGIGVLNATFKGTIGEAKTKPEDAPDPEPLPRIDKATGKATPAYLNWVARQAEKRVAVTR